MVRSLEATHYDRVSRYSTSASAPGLGRVLTRKVAPHIFESREEAQAFVLETERPARVIRTGRSVGLPLKR